ncbi:P-loop containing nucleoside triphosphate hydrolase protein [Exophiala viscosa]|uniref:P-loop containing nucleoside triphosphate hydrolase protein n=1 Tax=Exophiala viscosa TaxID=2486360 RepID=UPI0021946F75|nr:P-loop containing nucleoside triphosphate hydrolase protein [Exophiala viscosa]
MGSVPLPFVTLPHHPRPSPPEHPGSRLLNELPSSLLPLSELQIDQIVQYLESTDGGTTCCDDSNNVFVSKDLKIGQPRPWLQAERGETHKADTKLSTEQFVKDIQRAAFQFVKYDVRIEERIRVPRNYIKIAGVRRQFYPFQLYGAFWMLLKIRGHCRGALLADYMGLGKTTTTFLFILFEYLLVENERHIQTHPDQHCGSGVKSCPSAHLWPIVCACELGGVTRKLKLTPRPGGTIVFVPYSLLGNWDSEWTAFGVENTKGMRLCLHVHHREFARNRVPWVYRYHLSLEVDCGESPDATMTLNSTSRAHDMILLTTAGSYPQHVLRYFQRERPVRLVGGHTVSADDCNDGLAWARVIVDEVHLFGGNAAFYKILRSLSSNGWVRPNIIALSATPRARNGVSDMLPVVRAINAVSPDIAMDPDFRHFSSDAALANLDQQQQRLFKGELGPLEVSHHVQRVAALEVAYMIQRRDDTVQDDKPLATLPPLCCLDIRCPSAIDSHLTDETMVDDVLERLLSADLSRPIVPQAALDFDQEERPLRPRALATVPGLARLPGISGEVLTFDYILEQDWHLAPETSLYFRYFDELFASSSKLQSLRDIILRLDKDASGEPEKLVVISHLPVTCLCVVVLCIHLGIGWRWMTRVRPGDRNDLVNEFQAQGSVEDEDGAKPESRTFRVLIGTARIMAQGLTLHKANRLVLMEPSYSVTVEEQASKRVHRIGSRSDRCWFYRLVNPDSRLEMGILKAQARELSFEENVRRSHRQR